MAKEKKIVTVKKSDLKILFEGLGFASAPKWSDATLRKKVWEIQQIGDASHLDLIVDEDPEKYQALLEAICSTTEPVNFVDDDVAALVESDSTDLVMPEEDVIRPGEPEPVPVTPITKKVTRIAPVEAMRKGSNYRRRNRRARTYLIGRVLFQYGLDYEDNHQIALEVCRLYGDANVHQTKVMIANVAQGLRGWLDGEEEFHNS